MKRMRKVMALFVVVAMLFNLCPLSVTADVRRNNMPASLGNANIQPSNDDKGDKSATNQGATDAQAKNENKAASDAQAKSENKATTETKTKIDKEEDASDSTQIQADTSASEKTEETTATEKAADNKEASTEAVTDNTEASSTEVINDSEASTTETAVTNDEGKAQSEKDDDKAETKDEKSDKKDDEDKDEKMPAFSETKSVDGVKITVSADKDVFPKGVTLSIRKVSKADGKNVDKAIDKIREDGVNVAAAYTFDIKIVDKDGNEIQPADDKKVKVSFEAEEVGNDNLAADIYHITGKGKKLSAEMLDSAEHDDKVTASTGGFSLYTVEFTYDEKQYVMKGDTTVALSDILEKVGLTGEVSEVEVSDESLFSAKKKDGEWMVTANKAFSTTEWMKVTIDGVVYEIVVTDDYNNWIGDFSKMVTFAGGRDWYLISCDDTTATLWYYGTEDYFASYHGDDFNEEIGDVVANFKSDFEEKCNYAGIDTIDDVVAGGITDGVCLMSKSEAENVDASVKEVWNKTNVKFWLKPEEDTCVFISEGEVVEKSSSEMIGLEYTVNPIVKLNLDKISFDKNEGIITPKDDVTEVKLSDIKTGGLTLKVGETVEVDAENENYPSWLPYPTTDSCFSMYSDRAKSNEINTPTNTRYIYIFGTKTGSGQAIYNYSGDCFNVTVNANDSDSTKPDASFTATGSDSGILSNVEGGMQYSLDKGSSWVTIEDGKNSVDIDTGISSENGIKVFKPSSTITNPSDDIEGNQTQGISVTKGTTPTLTSVDPTSVGGKGKVTIPSDGYQQSSDNSTWTDVGSGDIELDAGTYYFRTKPDGTVLASDLQEITINRASIIKTIPAAINNLIYTGAAQQLVSAGEVESGSIQYALGNENVEPQAYDSSIPTGIDSGTYYVWYKVVGDDDSEIDKKNVPVTIAKKDLTIKAEDVNYIPPSSEQVGMESVTVTGLCEGHTLESVTRYYDSMTKEVWLGADTAVIKAGENNYINRDNYNITLEKGKFITEPNKERTITFKVENGSWGDGTKAPKTVNLEVGTSALSSSDIPPVGDKPDADFIEGSWDIVPDSSTTIWEDTTYTYTYAQKTSITPTVSISDWTYGETASIPSVNGNTGNGEVAYTYAKKDTTDFTGTVPSNAGEYTVKAVVAETDNYLGGEATADFTITKAEVTAPTITDKHYTGEAQTADVETSNLYTVTTNAGGTDVGDYDVVLTLKDAVNYKWTDSEDAAKTLKFNIIAATANNVTVSIAGWTYGKDAKTPTSTADFGADTATYTYSSSENGEYSADAPTDAGTWYVKASIPETENYPAGEAKTSFTITKAEVTAPTITDKHYTGEAQTADVEASDLYTVTTNNGGTKVGSYDVVLTLKDTTNYKWTDSEAAAKTLTFKIVPKDANIVTVSIEGWTFGEAAKTPTSTADFGADTATYTYSSSENGEYSDAVPTDAGTWYVKASVAETEDYPAGEDITSFVIAKAKVTSPTIANKNYTGDKQTADVETSDLYTVTTNNGGTDVGSYDVVLTLKDAVNYKWTDSEEAAKTLTFKIVTATANNVTVDIEGWTYGEAAKTPTATADFGADTATYTYSSSENGEYSADAPADAGTWYVKASIPATDNYPAGEVKTSFVISKAEVTTPAITEKHYTGKAQTADVEASDLYTVTTNNGGTDVGSYDVVLTLKDAVNYKWTDSEDAAKTLTFKIVPEDANIVTVNIDGWTYGEEAKAPKVTADFGADTATYTYSSSENGEYSDTVPTDAGTWYVKANIAATDDYSAGEAKNSFVIEPAAITIMADDKSTIYNEELAELTYTIGGGYVEDDDLGITLSTTATKESEPGDYPITVSWKENPNYDATLEDGQYTITKGGVSITVSGYSGKYDGKAHGITVKELEGESGELIGIFDGDSPEATVYYSTKELGKDNYKDDGSKELLTFTDAGKYTVYYYVQCKGYTIDPISGSKTVEITKVPLKVTAKDATITYGDKPDNDGVEYSGFVNDETKKVLKGTLSYNIDYEQYGDVGSSYSITPKGVTAKNYDITFVSGKLKVNPKKLTFTWDDADKTYNGKKQSVTAKAKTINDDVLTLTYSDNEKKNAGKYTAKITGVEGQKAANYKLSDDESTASCEWEIAKKKMSVTAKDVSVEYDEKEHGIEVKVTDPKSDYTITYGKEKGEYDSRKSPTITKEGSLTVYFKVEADNYITYTGSAKVTVKEKKEGTSSSSVEVKEGTPSVSVNGLDEEAKALQEGESADVNVTMSVEQVAEGSEGGDGITAIRNIAEGRMLTFFDIKVIKDVDSVKTVMDTTTNILEICIPYYHISEEGLAAYRYHGSSATRLTESDSRQDGTYRVDKITKKVYIYTNQFSIYAIGYTVKSSVNEEGDTVYDISGNIRYEDIDGMANLILYRNGEECKRGIAPFTGGVGTYQFEELKEGNYSLRITMDAGKDSFTLEIPIGDVSKQVVE